MLLHQREPAPDPEDSGNDVEFRSFIPLNGVLPPGEADTDQNNFVFLSQLAPDQRAISEYEPEYFARCFPMLFPEGKIKSDLQQCGFDIHNFNCDYGGIKIVLAGDFSQLGPITCKAPLWYALSKQLSVKVESVKGLCSDCNISKRF